MLTQIPGWSLMLHRYDLMHVLYLGICLHLVGSIIIDLSDRRFWQGANVKCRLRRAFYQFKRWVHDSGQSCSQSMFTPASLGRGKKPKMAEVKAKAHNCRVMVAWVAEICAVAPQMYPEDGALIATCTYAMAQYCYILQKEKAWKISQATAAELYRLGHMFLNTYQELSRRAVRARKRLYGSRLNLSARCRPNNALGGATRPVCNSHCKVFLGPDSVCRADGFNNIGGAPNTPGQSPFEFPAWPPKFRTVFGKLPGSRSRLPLRSRLRRRRRVSRIRDPGSVRNTSAIPAAKPEIQTDLVLAYSGPRLQQVGSQSSITSSTTLIELVRSCCTLPFG